MQAIGQLFYDTLPKWKKHTSAYGYNFNFSTQIWNPVMRAIFFQNAFILPFLIRFRYGLTTITVIISYQLAYFIYVQNR